MPDCSKFTGLRVKPKNISTPDLVQGLAIPKQGDPSSSQQKQCDRPQVRPSLAEAGTLEKGAADNAENVGQRKDLADRLCPRGHAKWAPGASSVDRAQRME